MCPPEEGGRGEAGPFQRLLSWLRMDADTAVASLPEAGDIGPVGPFQRFVPARFQPYSRRMFALRSRFVWVPLVTQVLLGLPLLYWAIQWAMPYLTGWRLALAPLILGCGVVGGRLSGGRVEVRWTAAGGSFSMASLWRAFLLLIPVFLLRALLRLLYRGGIADTVPLQRLLLFFVPGMLTTRATTVLIRMRQARKAFMRDA